MGLIDFSSLQLASLIVLNVLIGILVLSVGSKLSRSGDWLSVSAILGLLTAFVLAWNEYIYVGMSPVTFLRTWWSGGENSETFLLGFLNDPYSLTVCFLFCILSLMIFLAKEGIKKSKNIERIYASVPITLGGVSLCWISATPWLTFVGMFITILGGFLSCGVSWKDSKQESEWASRFFRDHCFGILISLTGACILLSVGVGLRWDQVVSDYFNPHIQLGFALFVMGLYIHFRPFPFSGWLSDLPEGNLLTRLFLMQIAPAWASYAFIFRTYPLLKATGVLEIFGWTSMAVAFVGYVITMFQKHNHRSLFSLYSSSSMLAVAILCFANDRSSFLFMVGASIFAILTAMVMSLNAETETKPKKSDHSVILKFFLFIGACGGAGVAGFISSGATLKWIHLTQMNGMLVAFTSLLLFMHVFQVWSLAWKVNQTQKPRSITSWSIACGVILVLMSTGLLWTGTFTGGLFFEDQDQIFFSFADLLFGSHQTLGGVLVDQQKFLTASSFYWAIVLLGLGSAYGARAQWSQFYEKFPKISRALENSLYFDFASSRMSRVAVSFLYRIEIFFSEKVFLYWIPKTVYRAFSKTTKKAQMLDRRLTHVLNTTAGQAVDLSAKVIQLIQNGDIQWYILVAFGTAIAMMLHFIQFG